MVLDLVDRLRCIEDHEDAWLVATVDARRDGRIVRGALGCPVCHRVYPIANGIADFRDRQDAAPRRDERTAAALAGVEWMRLAAQLDVRQAGALVVLAGEYARAGASLRDRADARVILVNPPSGVEGEATLLLDGRVPFAAGSLAGVAVDAALVLPGFVRALRIGGRVVAPAALPQPEGVVPLARDDREWVAERPASASPPVPLERRAPGGRPAGPDRR